MKKYRLLKDLPLYPSGTMCEIQEQVLCLYDNCSESVVKVEDDSLVEIISSVELRKIREDGRFDEWFKEIEEDSKVWEPKEGEEYWYTYGNGDNESDIFPDESNNKYSQSMAKSRVEIGNCFKTEEDAEKAVEKLKALRRLREKGLRFKSWEASGIHITIHASIPDLSCTGKDVTDLNLLFKGEG